MRDDIAPHHQSHERLNALRCHGGTWATQGTHLEQECVLGLRLQLALKPGTHALHLGIHVQLDIIRQRRELSLQAVRNSSNSSSIRRDRAQA